jgi:hypothetical protein
MLRGATAVVLAGLLAVACGESRPAARLFALADVYYPHGDFEGSALLRVDPTTLQPLERRGLRLGDAVTTRALSADGRTLALGASNFGEILFVDLAQPTRARRLTVVPGYEHDGGVETDVESWPLRSRLIVVATVAGAWWAPHPSQLLVVDPSRRRLVRRMRLQGTVLASVSVRDGTTALLVVRGRFPKLVAVRPDGSTWSRALRRLDLRGREHVRLDGISYRAIREPALASDGRRRVFVVASDRPIAEIRLSTEDVRYHSVALPHNYLSYPPPATPGSGGVHLRFATSAAWLGHGQLAIGGFDELPGWIRAFGTGHRLPQRLLQIVDTRSWRRTLAIRASSCEQTGAVTLCSAASGGFPPDGKGVRGPSLVAYDTRWHRLYEKRSPQLWWDVTAGRLVAGSADGQRISELDPATGRVSREITPAPLANEMWPLDLFTWRPPR